MSKVQFSCLYTKHKTQKKKIWKDGRISIHLTSGCALLYDASSVIGSAEKPIDEIQLTKAEIDFVTNLKTRKLESEFFFITIEGLWIEGNARTSVIEDSSASGSGTNGFSKGMQKVLQHKFKKPSAYIPPHPSKTRKRKLVRRVAPLQPGELMKRHYGVSQIETQNQHSAMFASEKNARDGTTNCSGYNNNTTRHEKSSQNFERDPHAQLRTSAPATEAKEIPVQRTNNNPYYQEEISDSEPEKNTSPQSDNRPPKQHVKEVRKNPPGQFSNGANELSESEDHPQMFSLPRNEVLSDRYDGSDNDDGQSSEFPFSHKRAFNNEQIISEGERGDVIESSVTTQALTQSHFDNESNNNTTTTSHHSSKTLSKNELLSLFGGGGEADNDPDPKSNVNTTLLGSEKYGTEEDNIINWKSRNYQNENKENPLMAKFGAKQRSKTKAFTATTDLLGADKSVAPTEEDRNIFSESEDIQIKCSETNGFEFKIPSSPMVDFSSEGSADSDDPEE